VTVGEQGSWGADEWSKRQKHLVVSSAGYADSPATTRVSVDSAGNIFTCA